MAEEHDDSQELEVSAGDRKLKIRGSDLLTSVIGMIVCSGLVLIGYILFSHKSDTDFILKDISASIKEGVVAQKEANCLTAYPIEQREKLIDFCRRMAK